MSKVHPMSGLVLSGFPKAKMVKLRYSQAISLDAGIATPDNYLFRANSCYDPNYTGVGHQPLWWDTWTTVYKRYVVLGSKIKVILAPAGASSPGGTVGIQLQKTTTANPYTNMDSYYESRFTRLGATAGNQSMNLVSYRKPITHTMSTKKFFGVADVKDNDDLGALTTGSPAQQCFYNVFYLSNDASEADNPALINLRVIIDYIVWFNDPILTTQS